MYMSESAPFRGHATNRRARRRRPIALRLVFGALLLASPAWAQSPPADWQTQVRKYADMKDWASAMRIVDQEIALAPGDMDVRSWRARVLEWSGNLAQAEQEYLQILQVSKDDPDNWLGLANVYLGEGKIQEALHALDVAVGLDPRRADLHIARGRALAAAGDRKTAQLEFQRAAKLDPANEEARAAQGSEIGRAHV